MLRLLAASVALASVAVSVQASPYPVGGITFPIGPLTFPSGPVSLPSAPIQTETATTIEVTLPADILFDFDKANIRPDAQKPLHEIAELVRQKAHGPVVIQGYTDALGSDVYNQKLSERRAAAVKIWLTTREGLRAARFTTVGFGSRHPVAPNRKPDGSDDPDGRQLNRRVTLIIRK